MQLLSILLQADVLPTNIWTVGGALFMFSGVIAYLFKLYDGNQEKRFTEMSNNLKEQIAQNRKDLEEEKLARRSLQDSVNNGQIAKNNMLLERLEQHLKI